MSLEQLRRVECWSLGLLLIIAWKGLLVLLRLVLLGLVLLGLVLRLCLVLLWGGGGCRMLIILLLDLRLGLLPSLWLFFLEERKSASGISTGRLKPAPNLHANTSSAGSKLWDLVVGGGGGGVVGIIAVLVGVGVELGIVGAVLGVVGVVPWGGHLGSLDVGPLGIEAGSGGSILDLSQLTGIVIVPILALDLAIYVLRLNFVGTVGILIPVSVGTVFVNLVDLLENGDRRGGGAPFVLLSLGLGDGTEGQNGSEDEESHVRSFDC
jgi:hypothetical protein